MVFDRPFIVRLAVTPQPLLQVMPETMFEAARIGCLGAFELMRERYAPPGLVAGRLRNGSGATRSARISDDILTRI
jgi:hypothetical protein